MLRIGSGDVYIVADVDDHELLKSEIAECRIVMKTMQSSIKERLRAYSHNTQVGKRDHYCNLINP